jgi:hypothetical protein
MKLKRLHLALILDMKFTLSEMKGMIIQSFLKMFMLPVLSSMEKRQTSKMKELLDV